MCPNSYLVLSVFLGFCEIQRREELLIKARFDFTFYQKLFSLLLNKFIKKYIYEHFPPETGVYVKLNLGEKENGQNGNATTAKRKQFCQNQKTMTEMKTQNH